MQSFCKFCSLSFLLVQWSSCMYSYSGSVAKNYDLYWSARFLCRYERIERCYVTLAPPNQWNIYTGLLFYPVKLRKCNIVTLSFCYNCVELCYISCIAVCYNQRRGVMMLSRGETLPITCIICICIMCMLCIICIICIICICIVCVICRVVMMLSRRSPLYYTPQRWRRLRGTRPSYHHNINGQGGKSDQDTNTDAHANTNAKTTTKTKTKLTS